MSRQITVAELQRKLENISAEILPTVLKAMDHAALNVEATAKKNCTPGHSPYDDMWFPTKWPYPQTGEYPGGAPYSDDRNPYRDMEHMKSAITHRVQRNGQAVHGLITCDKPYAYDVHEGTSKMWGRPFLKDAGTAERKETDKILSTALNLMLEKEAV